MSESPARLLAEAQALHQAGRLAEAAKHYEAVLKRRGDDATVLALLGALRLQQGDALAASKLLRRAADRRPQDPAPRYNLGVALNKLGRFAEAAAVLAEVTRAHPDHADAWKSLGDAQHGLDQPVNAIRSWRAALAARPDFPAALMNLGAMLLRTGESREAEACARRLLALRPDSPQALNNLGLALFAQHKVGEAEAAYRRALDLAPEHEKAIENLARLIVTTGRAAESVLLFRRVLDLQRQAGQPLSAEAFLGLLECQALLCDWHDLPALLREVLAREAAGPDPFILLAHDVPPQRLARIGLLYGRSLAGDVTPLPARRPTAEGRIRIGYLSSDFGDHAVASLICEAMELHDRAAFAVHAYATNAAKGSAYRARLAAGIETFREVDTLGDETIAEMIAADELDILVDLNGWTAHRRARTLAMRPAPVVATWLGFAASMGVPWIDYVVLDAIAAPTGCEAEFSEKIVRLPDCFQPNDRRRPVGPAPTREAEGLPAEGFVFATFASAFKIRPDVFDAWMRVLAAVPGSVLWLRNTGDAPRMNLRREAMARGIAGDRLVFADHAPDHAAHLGR